MTYTQRNDAGLVLASWAAREAKLRREAASVCPQNLSLRDGGLVVAVPGGQEVVWQAPEFSE